MIIEYLVGLGKQRPGSLKTLVGSSAALFQPRLDDPQVHALLEQRRRQGVYELDGNKVVYGLPD